MRLNRITNVRQRIRCQNDFIATLRNEKPILTAVRQIKAVKHAARPRIHTFISTSSIHIKHKLMKTEDEVLGMVHDQVTRARNWCDDVEWSAEDGEDNQVSEGQE